MEKYYVIGFCEDCGNAALERDCGTSYHNWCPTIGCVNHQGEKYSDDDDLPDWVSHRVARMRYIHPDMLIH